MTFGPLWPLVQRPDEALMNENSWLLLDQILILLRGKWTVFNQPHWCEYVALVSVFGQGFPSATAKISVVEKQLSD